MTTRFFPFPDQTRCRVLPVACQLRLTGYTSMPANDALVWQGAAENPVDPQAGRNPWPTLVAAVAEIISEFPDVKEK